MMMVEMTDSSGLFIVSKKERPIHILSDSMIRKQQVRLKFFLKKWMYTLSKM